MDFNRAVSTLLDSEQHRKAAVAAVSLIAEQLGEANLVQAEAAVFAALHNKYDEARRLAADLILQNVQLFCNSAFDGTFYAVTGVLDTRTEDFRQHEKLEDVREVLLTVLLKLLISMQNTFKTAEALEKAHIRYADAIVSLLCKQARDPYPGCKLQVDKCIYRLSLLFKHFLNETQIQQLSDAIVATFKHNQSAVRYLNLRAFVELHCCIQSKSINIYLQQLFPVLLRDSALVETTAECFFKLLTQHIDRHVYADVFAIPLLSNLYNEFVFGQFVQAGEFYVQETQKIDKFLHLQHEIESCVTGREAQFDAFIARFNAPFYPHFNGQLNLGCRVLAQQVMEKQLNAILRDLSAVQYETKQLAVTLLCNLVILSHSFSLKFGQKFVANLQLILHDEFNRSIFDKLLRLMAVMCAPCELIASVQKQIGAMEAENSRFLARLLTFLAQLICYRLEASDFAAPFTLCDIQEIIKIAAAQDCIFNEDFELVVAYFLLVANLVCYMSQTMLLEQLEAYQKAQVFMLLSAVFQKLAAQQMFSAKAGQMQEIMANNSAFLPLRTPGDVQTQFARFFSEKYAYLDFQAALQILYLNYDIIQTNRLQQKCLIFAQFLQFTGSFNFAQQNSQKAVAIAVRLLRVAYDFERNPQAVRAQCLDCVAVLAAQIYLQQDYLVYLLQAAFSCTTWKHGARSPECLVSALGIIRTLLCKQRTQICQPLPVLTEEKSSCFGAHFDKILSRCCVLLEDDYYAVREAALALISEFVCFVGSFGGQFDELGLKLALRLDDARENITLQALDYLYQVVALDKDMFSHAQIAELIIMHCDDPNARIRARCCELGKILIKNEKFRQSCLDRAKDINWQYLSDQAWIV